MRVLRQSIKNGVLRIVEGPDPVPGPTEVLVATSRSLVSVGTERAVRQLASASLLSKARARPDLVRQVVAKARAEGIRATHQAVQSRLEEDMPLGYSAAGRVLAVGEAVPDLRPGMRVATASAGHGDLQIVPGLLAVPVSESVSDEEAAFAAVAAIALQGLRQADVQTGGTVAVLGLGLIGQLTTRIALASGLNVIGIDLHTRGADLATAAGATGLVESGDDTTRAVLSLTKGRGVDAVLITAATPSSTPAMRSTEILRDRGRLVIVGAVGLDLNRTPFYEKELEIRFARSYGPGRYERTYEDYAIDYPIGHVRWTEARNMEAYLDLVGSGRLKVTDLVTRVFDLDQAPTAYDTIASDPEILGVQFTYPATLEAPTPRTHRGPLASSAPGRVALGLIGAGTFVQSTLLPALEEAGLGRPLAIASAGGTSATTIADRFGILTVSPDTGSLLALPHVDSVIIASRHDSHAELAVAALKAGKHVFVEKPLALTQGELADIEEAHEAVGTVLWVGFNRRHAPAVVEARERLGPSAGPLVITYRVNAGSLPDKHWYHDRRQGGRLLGEVCHFVDTASALVGAQPESVIAFADGAGEALLQEHLTVLLRYPDGSSASIAYSAGGSPRTAKEQIDVLGRGHTITIDNFSRLTVDGSNVKLSSAGKGHAANLAAFARAVRTGEANGPDTQASIATTRAMLAAAASLSDQRVQQLL